MRTAFAAAILISIAGNGAAQQYASNAYTVCPANQTEQGRQVVEAACGEITRPPIVQGSINSLTDLQSAQANRDAFTQQVTDYGVCITNFINSYRRPGADATSTAPDEAACAHAWAEDQVTQSVMEYGQACIEFSNRSMTDTSIEPWSGACYPSVGNGQG